MTGVGEAVVLVAAEIIIAARWEYHCKIYLKYELNKIARYAL